MTLAEARRVEAAATPAARALIKLLLVGIFAVPAAIRLAHLAPVRIALTVGGPLVLVGLLVLALRFRRTSPERVNPVIQWAGTLAIAGAVAFDVIITLVKDPQLAVESNVFARMLLDSGHSVLFVKVYGATCQALLVAMLAVMLAAALAHVEPLRTLAWGMGPRSRKEFVAAATRGNTNASPLFGLRPRDWTSMKAHAWLAWIAAILCIGSCIGRPLIALEWLDFRLPPVLRLAVIAVGAMLLVNGAWARSWRRGPPPELGLETPGETPALEKRQRLEGRLFWLSMALLLVALLAVPRYRQAAAVAARLDERIRELQVEVADGEDAASRAGELAAEVERLQAEWDQSPAARALPCKADDATTLAEVRAIVEPLGVHVASDHAMDRPRMKEFYDEIVIHVVMPDEKGAAVRLARALAGSERLVVVPSPHEERTERIIVAFAYRCSELVPTLREHRERPWGREDLVWPFDRGVMRREREVERLRVERDRHADALILLLRERALTWDPLESTCRHASLSIL